MEARAESPALLPSFFVIGPPRTGTTWIYEILKNHTVLPSPIKETRFFDTHFQRGLRWYTGHFKVPDQKVRVGEIAPTYFASEIVRERMRQVVPHAKIVCILRNPVVRLYSLYRLKCAYGMMKLSFEEALQKDLELRESSDYVSHLKAWQSCYGKERILTTLYDDLHRCPQQYLDTLTAFIGVPRLVLPPEQMRLVHDSESLTHPRSFRRTQAARVFADFLKARRMGRVVAAFNASSLRRFVLGGGAPFPDMSPSTVLRLYDSFRPQVEELEAMLNRDLSAWKSPARAACSPQSH